MQSSLFLLFCPLAIQVGFQGQRPSITEGSNFNAVIQCQTIANRAPIEVTVFFTRYTRRLSPYIGALGPQKDGMNINVRTSN